MSFPQGSCNIAETRASGSEEPLDFEDTLTSQSELRDDLSISSNDLESADALIDDVLEQLRNDSLSGLESPCLQNEHHSGMVSIANKFFALH